MPRRIDSAAVHIHEIRLKEQAIHFPHYIIKSPKPLTLQKSETSKLGYKDSNLEMTESESVALPFGDSPIKYMKFCFIRLSLTELGYKDLNLEMTESESVALPFGDSPPNRTNIIIIYNFRFVKCFFEIFSFFI